MSILQKVLFCATVDFHFEKFHLPYMKWFKEQGYEVHVAAKGQLELPYVDQKYDIDIQRSPFRRQNLNAYKELKAIMEHNQYDLIHCHTPMGGVLARLAAKKIRKQGTRVLYTAHGFHFYKGAPLINWLVYYPIEKSLAYLTDCLITINKEDYHRAMAKRFKAGQIKHVHGVGIDTNIFHPLSDSQKISLRESFGYQSDDFLMFYAAEFNQNKNHQLLIRALAKMKDQAPQAKLLLAGNGALMDEIKELAAELHVDERIEFLGYQNKVLPFLQMSDVAVASSLREGLPVNVMESMACGLPIVATDNRGHRELVRQGENGWIIANKSIESFADKLVGLFLDPVTRMRMGQYGQQLVLNHYSTYVVKKELTQIYESAAVKREEPLRWANQ